MSSTTKAATSTSTSTSASTTTATAPASDAYSAKKSKGPTFRRRNRKKKRQGAGDEKSGFTAAQLRVQKDLSDLDLPTTVVLRRKENKWLNFDLLIKPSQGYWKGAMYRFNFNIPSKYPFDGPKVTCVNKIYHPNIDLEGKVCVNVLRPWKPTYSVQIILFGLMFLFTHPNPNDPLNKDAAADMRANLTTFAYHVKESLKGNSVKNKDHVSVSFQRNVAPSGWPSD